MRENLAIPEAQWPQAISELCAIKHIEQVLFLVHVTEFMALSWYHGAKEVTEWMSGNLLASFSVQKESIAR